MSDLIDRQAAIDAIQQHREGVLGGYEYDEGVAFVYAAAHNHIIDVIKRLPSAQPERKKGHWVEIGDEPYDEWECDVCGFVIDGSGCIDPEEYRDVYRFCPRCGSDMRGEQDE